MDSNQTTKPDIEAEIHALPSDKGGRTTAMRSGYHPNHDFGLQGELNDARHEYPETGTIAPGESGIALLRFLCPERQNGRLFDGMEFTVQEGSKVVGTGRIIRVLNDALRRCD